MNLISELLKINEHILCMWLALFVDTFHLCHSPYLIIFISLLFLLSLYHYSAIFHSLALITNSMHNVQRTITLSLSLNIVLVSCCCCHFFLLSKFIQWMKPGHCVLFLWQKTYNNKSSVPFALRNMNKRLWIEWMHFIRVNAFTCIYTLLCELKMHTHLLTYWKHIRNVIRPFEMRTQIAFACPLNDVIVSVSVKIV